MAAVARATPRSHSARRPVLLKPQSSKERLSATSRAALLRRLMPPLRWSKVTAAPRDFSPLRYELQPPGIPLGRNDLGRQLHENLRQRFALILLLSLLALQHHDAIRYCKVDAGQRRLFRSPRPCEFARST